MSQQPSFNWVCSLIFETSNIIENIETSLPFQHPVLHKDYFQTTSKNFSWMILVVYNLSSRSAIQYFAHLFVQMLYTPSFPNILHSFQSFLSELIHFLNKGGAKEEIKENVV